MAARELLVVMVEGRLRNRSGRRWRLACKAEPRQRSASDVTDDTARPFRCDGRGDWQDPLPAAPSHRVPPFSPRASSLRRRRLSYGFDFHPQGRSRTSNVSFGFSVWRRREAQSWVRQSWTESRPSSGGWTNQRRHDSRHRLRHPARQDRAVPRPLVVHTGNRAKVRRLEAWVRATQMLVLPLGRNRGGIAVHPRGEHPETAGCFRPFPSCRRLRGRVEHHAIPQTGRRQSPPRNQWPNCAGMRKEENACPSC